MKYVLKDGKEVNLIVNYNNLFKFQREYKYAKDLVPIVMQKGSADLESIIQIVYVGYMGGNNPEPIMSYEEFLNNIDFNLARDLNIFSELVSNRANEKN